MACVSWTCCKQAAVQDKANSWERSVLPLVRIALVCAGTLNYIADSVNENVIAFAGSGQAFCKRFKPLTSSAAYFMTAVKGACSGTLKLHQGDHS